MTVGNWTQLHQNQSTNVATASTSLTMVASASSPGTLLLTAICVAGGGAITPPPGWLQIASTTLAGGGTLALFIYENNPGGIINQVFTFASSLAVGFAPEYQCGTASVSGAELDQISVANATQGNTVAGTTISGQQQTQELVLAVIGCTFGATPPTVSSNYQGNSPFGFDSIGVVSNTAASANAWIVGKASVNTSQPCGYTGTLNAGPVTGPSIIVAGFTQGLLLPNNGNVGPALYLG